MEFFYGGGGSSNPYFAHRIKVKKVSNEMFEWCNDYEVVGAHHFARWHCEHGSAYNRDHDVVQFEREEPALMFALKFGGQ
jgi:hypothetical protein